MKKKKKIILASLSLRRIELLKKWGLVFDVVPSKIEEKCDLKRPSYVVKYLSYKKAELVKKNNPNYIVIGSDTVVFLNGKILGKPKNKQQSISMVKELNGSTHRVYTGVSILSSKLNLVFYDVAIVKMKKLADDELQKLFGKNMDKAGSYAVQDKNDSFVKKIYGDYFTVVGLPYIKLREKLKLFNITIR